MNTEPSQAPQVISKSLVAAASNSLHPSFLHQAHWAGLQGCTAGRQHSQGQPPYGDALLSQFTVPQAEVISQLIEQMFSGSLGEPFPRCVASLGRWQCCFSHSEMGWGGVGGRGGIIWSTMETA